MIAGLGEAARLINANLGDYALAMQRARQHLEACLMQTFGAEGVVFNGKCSPDARLPNTCNFSLLGAGLCGSKILAQTKGIKASVGAACHSATTDQPSSILLACGIPSELAINAQRWSVGRETTMDDIERAVACLSIAVRAVQSQP